MVIRTVAFAGARNAAVALLAAAHRQLGPGLADMVRQNVKPALMATLEEAFAANPLQQASRLRMSESHGLLAWL